MDSFFHALNAGRFRDLLGKQAQFIQIRFPGLEASCLPTHELLHPSSQLEVIILRRVVRVHTEHGGRMVKVITGHCHLPEGLVEALLGATDRLDVIDVLPGTLDERLEFGANPD